MLLLSSHELRYLSGIVKDTSYISLLNTINKLIEANDEAERIMADQETAEFVKNKVWTLNELLEYSEYHVVSGLADILRQGGSEDVDYISVAEIIISTL